MFVCVRVCAGVCVCVSVCLLCVCVCVCSVQCEAVWVSFFVRPGIWTEIPLIINQLPEHNAISSQVGVAYNVGNVFPFLYVALRRVCLLFVFMTVFDKRKPLMNKPTQFMPPEKYSFIVLTLLSSVPGVVLGLYWQSNNRKELFFC